MSTTLQPTKRLLSILGLAVLLSACLLGSAWASEDDNDDFLAANAGRDGVISLGSGLQYEIITQGDGARPEPDDTVVVHYRGALVDGTMFDSSYERQRPARLPLDKLIDGWREALPLMPVGSKWRLYIPPELGYGPRGMGPVGPNATLVYDVELLSIVGSPRNDVPPAEHANQIADIRFLFKLDPRLTRSLYMGDRWVAPSTAGHIQVGDASGVHVAVRVVGVDGSNRPLQTDFDWLVEDPEIATVSSEAGGEATLTVVREGTTTVRAVGPGASRPLLLTATRTRGVLKVQVHQGTTDLQSASTSLGDRAAEEAALRGR